MIKEGELLILTLQDGLLWWLEIGNKVFICKFVGNILLVKSVIGMTNAVIDGSPVKMILVTGGVISGVGKGIISSSLGVLLKAHGFHVSIIKIDPYINLDAGTFSPFEHGKEFLRPFSD